MARVSKYMKLNQNILMEWIFDSEHYVSENYKVITNLNENKKRNFLSTNNLNNIDNNLFQLDPVLRKYTKMWDEFIEADGTITSAYGYRWRHYFGRDQLNQLVEHLREEPHSRQGVVITWDAGDDGLYGKGLKATYKKKQRNRQNQ